MPDDGRAEPPLALDVGRVVRAGQQNVPDTGRRPIHSQVRLPIAVEIARCWHVRALAPLQGERRRKIAPRQQHIPLLSDWTIARATACSSLAVDRSTDAMALSAIVLEEAYGRGGASSDDGMLTPLELQNVDLRGTEMLVLSQCRMAHGVASVGEGVYGMRRAAIVAGAQAFVAPLWNVDDRVQRSLMAHFYRALARGQTRADALREAKLALRRSPDTRSFLYWAPVILSGSASPLPQSLFRPAAVTASRGRAR